MCHTFCWTSSSFECLRELTSAFRATSGGNYVLKRCSLKLSTFHKGFRTLAFVRNFGFGFIRMRSTVAFTNGMSSGKLVSSAGKMSRVFPTSHFESIKRSNHRELSFASSHPHKEQMTDVMFFSTKSNKVVFGIRTAKAFWKDMMPFNISFSDRIRKSVFNYSVVPDRIFV